VILTLNEAVNQLKQHNKPYRIHIDIVIIIQITADVSVKFQKIESRRLTSNSFLFNYSILSIMSKEKKLNVDISSAIKNMQDTDNFLEDAKNRNILFDSQTLIDMHLSIKQLLTTQKSLIGKISKMEERIHSIDRKFKSSVISRSSTDSHSRSSTESPSRSSTDSFPKKSPNSSRKVSFND